MWLGHGGGHASLSRNSAILYERGFKPERFFRNFRRYFNRISIRTDPPIEF
jgi:hypothetical protein